MGGHPPEALAGLVRAGTAASVARAADVYHLEALQARIPTGRIRPDRPRHAAQRSGTGRRIGGEMTLPPASAAGLHAEAIRKSFGGIAALDGVSLHVAPGEVHGLCGENGAGKSTLIRICGGMLAPDTGHVTVDGAALPSASVRAAEAHGIVVIHQEPLAFPDLSAEDSIFVGHEPARLGGFWLDRRTIRQQTSALLDRLGERFDPSRRVGDLPLAQRQMVAIARALSRRCRYLILDEPTAALSARETRVLLDLVKRLASEGVGIVYVSHRLEEVLEITTRVSVLRDGRPVGDRSTAEISRAEL